MLFTARAQALADQLLAVETATASFEAAYGALPGDFANTNNGLSGSGGNNSGSIDSGTEVGRVFTHLSSANLFKGTYSTMDASEGCTSAACPSTAFGGVIMLSSSANRINAASVNALEITTGAGVPAKQLADVDRKIDDGNPRTGIFRAHAGNTFSACITETGWNESANPRNCAGVYVVQ